jgi:hypothetical protein
LREIVLIRFGKNSISRLGLAGAVFFSVLLWASCCYSADVVFVRAPVGSSAEQEQLQTAATFYGVNLKVITAGSAKDDLALLEAVGREETVGVAVAANALTGIHRNALLQAMRRRRGSIAPLLVLGVGQDVDPTVLTSWSGGTTLGCKPLENSLGSQYVFGRVDGITGQLSNLEVRRPNKDMSYLELGENNTAQRIISVRQDRQVFPLFIEITDQQNKLFVACAMPPEEGLKEGEDVRDAFLQIAPAMMFIKYCAGEQGWHPLHRYANLTIDDPWLRPYYGRVYYKGLLAEMEQHGFHTTIAFIPWNYDRSDPAVVSLFRNHPDRFSISVHGDNHDHKEFTDYRSKSLAVQVADLKQSLARMERFQALTGIPYDKVMVFPHSIAPEGTLAALKTYNYLATVNSVNVPQGSVSPTDLSFALRPVTLSFGGFPSISRASWSESSPESRLVEGKYTVTSFIAINEFLGNPLLFYGHSDDFAKGADSFDPIADQVNKLEPETQWRGLGEIVKHLYAIKLRDDSDYDVLSFSSNICLDNYSGRDSIYYVRKREIGGQTIKSVQVDGRNVAYTLQDGYLNFSTPVSNGHTRCAAVDYQNDLDLASISISKDSLTVYLLRMASDFRDNKLSKYNFGLALIRFYNQHQVTPSEFLLCGFALMLICLYASYRLFAIVTRKHAGLPTAKPINR